jgi:hypothetical protein
MSRAGNDRFSGNAGAARRHRSSPICPTTAGIIRLGRPPSATTGAANMSIYSSDDAGSHELKKQA